ncbi:MAG: GNAT family N-acetyltransferase [Bacteroides sp.]
MLTIRRATIDDCELIHALAAIAFPATYQEILSPEQLDYMMEWMYAPANLHKQMEEEGHVYFIASLNGEACGYVSVQPEEADLFHLQKIYVLPQFQGKHLGKCLFEHAIRYIEGVHPSPCLLELNVNRNNRAVHFYERMGMTRLREGDFPIGNGYYMNDYIMGLPLPVLLG